MIVRFGIKKIGAMAFSGVFRVGETASGSYKTWTLGPGLCELLGSF